MPRKNYLNKNYISRYFYFILYSDLLVSTLVFLFIDLFSFFF